MDWEWYIFYATYIVENYPLLDSLSEDITVGNTGREK